ncbi:hypothetical protein [Streptomyces sp. NRRL F-4489]|uniref:hypothetical protein n=1 Tax=Streptomyces sp. NRRL F-4489 TaxID=1609095 RepID=UPI00131C5174|nr:hypothetical protein [Streptomyces sp. NRRL F-4489]
MNWGSQISTVIGVVLGIGATLLGDRVRYRREQATRSQEVLRDLYVRYLNTLNESSSSIRLIVIKETDPAARYQAALDAFRESSVLEHRYEINLLAPLPVKEKSDQAYRLLRKLRDLLETKPDITLTSTDYLEALDQFHNARKELQEIMRANL